MQKQEEHKNETEFEGIPPIKNKFYTENISLLNFKKVDRKQSVNLLNRRQDLDLENLMPNFINHYDGIYCFNIDLINKIQEARLNHKSEVKLKPIELKHKKYKHSSSSIRPSKIANLITTQKKEKDNSSDIKSLTNIEEIRDFYEYTENCMRLIIKLKKPKDSEIEHLKIDLPNNLLDKKLAIFDLDETLIHCELKNPTSAHEIVKIKLPNGSHAKVKIFNLNYFLTLFLIQFRLD